MMMESPRSLVHVDIEEACIHRVFFLFRRRRLPRLIVHVSWCAAAVCPLCSVPISMLVSVTSSRRHLFFVLL